MPSDLDFILIASDGIWECKSNEEIVDFVYKTVNKDKFRANLQEICKNIINECLSPDNIMTSK